MTKNFIQSLHCGGHGVLHRAAVGDDGICRREIQGAALRLHLPERLGAGRERPSAAHRQRIQRPVDKEHDAVLVQGAQIFAPLDDAAAAGEQLTALFCKAGGLGRLPRPEAVLTLGGEDVRDAAAIGLHDLLVEVDEPLAQLVCQQTAHRGLAAGGHPDEGHIQHIAAERGGDAADLPRRVVELPAEEVFSGVHRLRHQHLEASHGHRDAGLLSPQDEFGLVRVIHHVQHRFQPGHSGNVQTAHPYVGVHPGGGGVDDDLCAAGHSFLIGELALGGVGRPADGQHLRRALVPGDGTGGVVGAAGAEDEDGPAREIDAVGVTQMGKTEIVGVVAVEQAVLVDDGVHRADGLGPGVDVGAVLHHQPLIGDGDIDGLELPLGEEGPGLLLGGQGAEVVAVAAEHLVDELRVGVAQLRADESVFHHSPSLR